MKKRTLTIMLCLFLFLFKVQAGIAAPWFEDPILFDMPSDKVYDCRNDIFIEIIEDPMIGRNISNRTAEDNFLYLTVRFLYLAEPEMAGFDKTSFTVRHISEENIQTSYPLNFMVTMLTNRMKSNAKLTGRLRLPTYGTLTLVFDVDTTNKNNWELVFTPTERGSSVSYCEIDVPLKVR